MLKVLKRDKTVELFQKNKIERAVRLAFESCGKEFDKSVTDCVESNYKLDDDDVVDVESIQDTIENCLMSIDKDVAKAYIIYRYEHKLMRDNKNKLTKQIKKKLTAEDVQNQNANVDEFSFGGRMGEATRVVTKEYALENCMSKKSRKNHLNNEIYIHDLDSYAVGEHNCAKGNSWVKIKHHGEIRLIQLNNLALEIGVKDNQLVDVSKADWQILSRDGWTKLKNISQRKTNSDELIYEIKTRADLPLELTGKHRIPVIREGKEIVLEVKDVKEGDKLLGIENVQLSSEENDTSHGLKGKFLENKIISVRTYHEDCSVFDMETESHWYIINNYVSHNCLTYPLDESLSQGVKTRQTDIRPAKSISTAFQLIAVFFQIQSLQQFGGVSCSHLDWTMVPYVRMSFFKHFVEHYIFAKAKEENVDLVSLNYPDREKYKKEKRDEFKKFYGIEDETYRIGDFSMQCINFHVDDDKIKEINPDWHDLALIETKEELAQAIEGMYHNLNSLQSRSGCQLPFTSINYGTCTLAEGRMVIRALLEGSLKGVGPKHLTPIFPCGIFQLMKGVNRKEGEPNYDLYKLALKSTSLRIYPNYANVDWSVNEGYDRNNPRTYVSTMGCHKKGTKIVMADESLKTVEDIQVNDKVMGIDGNFRTVNDLIRGNGKMYEISQSHGQTYVVNDEHILSVIYCSNQQYKDYKKGQVVNITVNDYLKIPENLRSSFKGYKAFVKEPTMDFELSTLTIKEIGNDDFYGFDIDGDKLYMLEDGTVTHNCRTYNGSDINALPGVNPQMKDGRGNLCPVTIIMPTLAMESDRDTEKFMKLLDKKIHEAKDMLLERFGLMCKQSPKSAKYMWENHTMFGYDEKEGPISALRHGTLVIGQIALAETLQLLIGTDQTTEKGMELAKRIEGLFKTRCAEFKKEYHLNFGVYMTPAENLCYTSFKKFKAKYGDIENVTYYIKDDGTRKDKKYFTNSIHVPVYEEMDPFEKIDIESQLTCFSNAGCITYVELPSSTKNNIEGLETIVNYAMDKDIPYFAVNVPIDECHDCGYTDEMGDVCPECGGHHVEHLRRVTGR